MASLHPTIDGERPPNPDDYDGGRGTGGGPQVPPATSGGDAALPTPSTPANASLAECLEGGEQGRFLQLETGGPGVGIRSSPAYPGDRTGESAKGGEIHEFIAKRIVQHNDGERRAVEIFFYELADGRGWIHDYNPKSPPGHSAITVLRGARALKAALEKHEANAEPNLTARAWERLRELATEDLAQAIEGLESNDGGRGSSIEEGGARKALETLKVTLEELGSLAGAAVAEAAQMTLKRGAVALIRAAADHAQSSRGDASGSGSGEGGWAALRQLRDALASFEGIADDATLVAAATAQAEELQAALVAAAIEGIQSDEDPKSLLAATTQLRKQLSIERNPPIQAVIDSGSAVPRLILLLGRDDEPPLQLEAAWCLTNIVSGTTEHVQHVLDQGGLEPLVGLLASPNEEVREQALWALGNIAGDLYMHI